MSTFFKSNILVFFVTLFCIQNLLGQEIPKIGHPWVQQYTKFNYNAGNQNWSVATDSSGVIYVGNGDGLLQFDGQVWSLHTLPNKSTVRAVTVGPQQRIYTGGMGEFGYWEKSKIGKLTYHSISKLVSKETILKDEIWKIIIDGKRVIFQSFANLYCYENGKIDLVSGNNQPFLFAFKANNRIFIEKLPGGLFELKNKSLIPLKGNEVLRNQLILSILPLSGQSVLIGTAKNGLYSYDDEHGIRPWNNEINEQLKNAQLNNGIQVFKDYYAYGTILNGIFIINKEGQLIQHINKQNGLQNNTVLSLTTDLQKQIWAGLDNGIARIDIQSPLYFYADNSGSIGTVYSARIFNGYLYLGTNQGLFYSPWSSNTAQKPMKFNLVPQSQGQVWDLSVIDGELICGHNDGTFKVSGQQFVKISDMTGGWVIKQIKGHSNLLIQGNYTGMALFRKGNNGWTLDTKINNRNLPVSAIEQKSENQFWVSNAQGLNLISTDSAYRNIIQTKEFGTKEGLPSRTGNHPTNLNGSIIFSTDSGFYRYDDISDKFAPYRYLNEKLGSFAYSNKIIPAQANQFWFINKGHIAYASFMPKGELQIDSSRFATLKNQMMKYYENINQISPDLFLISIDNGFALYNPETKIEATSYKPKPIIQGVYNITKEIKAFTDSDEELSIPYSSNNIRIRFAIPWYSSRPVRFQYFLEGYSQDWSDWSEEYQKDFTNLRNRNYTFKVRAQLPDGTITDVTSLEFTVNPPWYLTWWALLIYFLLFAVCIHYGRKWYEHKLEKHRKILREKLSRQQEETLKKEMEARERQMVQLKNEQLEQELAGKNRELANSAMNIVYKNELLNTIHEELISLKDNDGKKLSNEHVKKISKIINEAYNDERDWNLFEKSFNEAHENFFKKLKKDYPALVPNDLKLCAYLRMNMNSKEIASLLNITTRGVEIRRYRLRKKLNIPTEKNLSEFLLEV
ncbi:ligand-binding sensor domain-containing protein [Sphingobacterium spiritivorum]|uniref:transcriptional regulator n=1 Tax=Sphingobacterium spiritivorum TaxID=258 RepID=UPI001918BC1A|nr:transcriptional regulator [Sphingobacterium spiritivorum]QQS96554.1 transcriptional regulator [Sphingobacterium spiritivorum]